MIICGGKRRKSKKIGGDEENVVGEASVQYMKSAMHFDLNQDVPVVDYSGREVRYEIRLVTVILSRLDRGESALLPVYAVQDENDNQDGKQCSDGAASD